MKQSNSDVKRIVDHLARPLQDAAEALACIANALEGWLILERQRFEKECPQLDIKPVSVGVAKYKQEEKVPEEQGAVFPEDEIGPRERRALALEEKRARQQKPKPRRS